MRIIRDLMLQVDEVAETKNPFAVAKNIMDALSHDLITLKEFELLTGTLQINCIRYKISTENEFVSLF